MAIVVEIEIYDLKQLRQVAGLTFRRLAKVVGFSRVVLADKLSGRLPVYPEQIDLLWKAFCCGGDRVLHIDRDDFIGLLPFIRQDGRRTRPWSPTMVVPTLRQQRAKNRKQAREGMRRLRKARREAKLANWGE